MAEPATDEIPVEETEDISEDELFEKQRAAIAERLKDDETYRLCIAEIYMALSNMDRTVRTFAANGGIGSMLKMLIRGAPKE